jgi:hypothetical protein
VANNLKQMASEIQHPRYQARPRLETALLAALVVLLFWMGILPAWRVLNTDFPNYYLVARLLREGYSLDRVYDWIWLQRIKDHWGIDQSLVGFAGLTPFSALPIFPLSIFSALTAKRIWIVVNLILLAGSTELLHRSTALGRRRIWLLALLAILPLRTNFLFGQMHLLVLFLMVLAWYFHHRNRELACGACVACAAALKVYPLLFVLFFLWKRQWRAALATLATAVIIVLIGSLWMGKDLLSVYALQMLPRSLQGETLDPYNFHAASAATLFHHLFLFEPALNPAPAFDSPSLYAVLYPLWQVAIFLPLLAVLRPSPTDPDREQMEWAAFLFCLLVLSPVPSSYHFVVMILPVILCVDMLLRRNKPALALAATSLYFLISVAGLFNPGAHWGPVLSTLLAFSRLWFGIALFALFLVCLYTDRTPHLTRHATLRAALLVILAILGLATSIAGYRHHFFHRRQEMSRRIPAPSPTYLATLPRSEPRGYLFVAMLPEGYRVLNQNSQKIAPNPNAGKTPNQSPDQPPDQLSYAIAHDHIAFAELADSNGSRIVRLSDNAVVAQDAESPAISADDKTLAFLRESRGRGSLWASRLDHSPDSVTQTLLPDSPTRLTGDDYDVRSASFLRSGALLFLAKHDGHSGLFTVNPGAPPVTFFANESIESFAVSPDERLIAFTALIHNRWQLASLDTLSRRVTVLTSEDCNAYTPAWSTSTKIIYATDCGRGLGLTALASIDLSSIDAAITLIPVRPNP